VKERHRPRRRSLSRDSEQGHLRLLLQERTESKSFNTKTLLKVFERCARKRVLAEDLKSKKSSGGIGHQGR
jgi:hypothetical protein